MKKVFLILVLCLSVVGISACGASVPKEVEIGPNTVKILEVGKDIAPGTYVAETDGAVYKEGSIKRKTSYVITTKADPRVDEIKTDVANGNYDWYGPANWKDNNEVNTNDKIVASENKLIIFYSAGTTTLKLQ